MTYRLYYWFDGTPADRPGGPWWYRDFSKGDERWEHLLCLRPFLRRWAETHGESPLPTYDPMKIWPPEDLTLYTKRGGSWRGHIMHYGSIKVEGT